MLLELEQSSVARDGLDAACSAVVELLEHLATEDASLSTIEERWNHGRKPRQAALEAVLALTIAQRTGLLKAVKFDLGFVDCLDDPTFSFQFPTLDAETRNAGKNLLVSMYEEVFCHHTGFIFGSDDHANRTTWERAFRDANPGVGLCPACATSLLQPPAAGRTLVDADHYLPKAIYPALAVHGLNLVPLCKSCNGALKASKDPLARGTGSCGLPDIWFPYKRPGVNEIGLSFDLALRAEERVSFTGGPAARDRGQRFDDIFQVLTRWSSNLTTLQQRLPRELKRLPVSADREGVRAGLRKLRRWAEEDRNYDTHAFLKSHYYAWVERDAAAVEALVVQVSALPDDPDRDD